MLVRTRRIALIMLLAIVAGLIGYLGYTRYRKAKFLGDLHVVGFSTSMIGFPKEERLRAAMDSVHRLDIDLFEEYQKSLDSALRFQLAFLLVVEESEAYCDFAAENIETIPWPEVRIWRFLRHDESLSREFRERLLKLVLASPTSEAKLSAGRWYREQGQIEESEDAYVAAMTDGEWLDELDAAYELTKSRRYRDRAIRFLLARVADEKCPVDAPASHLRVVYRENKGLGALVELCLKDPTPENRAELVERMKQIVRQDLGPESPAEAERQKRSPVTAEPQRVGEVAPGEPGR